MNSNFDAAFEKFKDYDFADAKPVSDVPVLARLQADSCMLLDKGHAIVGWVRRKP